MNHKDKAIELIDKFSKVGLQQRDEGIECALIAVDEIINSNPIIPLEFMLESESIDAALIYWNQIKKEIELIKSQSL